MRFPLLLTIGFVFFGLCCCSTDKEILDFNEEIAATRIAEEAVVTKVEVSGGEFAYGFSVTIKSPDIGCEQYADWWEVIDLEENLIYRRILAHSHVEEQPFTRSGGEVAISETTEVYIRVHMNNSGYSSKVLKGSVSEEFLPVELSVEFAKSLAETDPLPDGCAF